MQYNLNKTITTYRTSPLLDLIIYDFLLCVAHFESILNSIDKNSVYFESLTIKFHFSCLFELIQLNSIQSGYFRCGYVFLKLYSKLQCSNFNVHIRVNSNYSGIFLLLRKKNITNK